jgi:plastocyanin
MKRCSKLRLIMLACFGACAGSMALVLQASPVSVNVTSAAGAAATDTIVVFDPLDTAPPPKRATAVVDQINKRFAPRVSVVRTGTSVTFPNSDHIRHQVYSFSVAKPFTLKLYAGSPPTDIVFDKPGLVVLGCNIHDTMVGYVGVVDSPYFGLVNESGAVALELPVGHYKLRIWNPNLAATRPTQEVEVTAAPLQLVLTIELDPNRETVADWP